MAQTLDIALVGDFNFNLNAHIAMNLALKDVIQNYDLDFNYFWIGTDFDTEDNLLFLNKYDGFIVCSGPYKNPLNVLNLMKLARQKGVPLFATSNAFKIGVLEFLESHFSNSESQLLQEFGKLQNKSNHIEDYFPVQLLLAPNTFISRCYHQESPIEQSNQDYKLDKDLERVLDQNGLKTVAEDLEENSQIYQLENHPFYFLCKFAPQFTTNASMPHPLLTAFINACFLKIERGIQILD